VGGVRGGNRSTCGDARGWMMGSGNMESWWFVDGNEMDYVSRMLGCVCISKFLPLILVLLG
jgi:hypothetical protein